MGNEFPIGLIPANEFGGWRPRIFGQQLAVIYMLLNKKDTSILTLTLLLSIATSPIAWATSRWNSNSSVNSSALSESSLLSPAQVRNINIVPPVGEFKPKPGSDSGLGLSSQQQILLSQIDSGSPQTNANNDSLVGQSSQMQPTTVPATEGEIPIWLWWLLPVIPFLGLWVNLQLKAQRSKSPVKKQEDPISVPLSTKPDVTGEQPQKNSTQLDFNSLTEPLKTPFSPNSNYPFIEPLKTPFSPAVTTVSLPRTIIQKRHQTETFQLENNLQTQGSSISLIESERDNLDSEIAISPHELILFENQVKIPPEGEFFIPANSPEPEFYPIKNGGIEEISEVVLIKEIDPDEAETVIAEFLTTKTQIENIPVSEIVESELEIQNKSIILESDIIKIESTVAAVDDQLTEPEIPVSEIVESELEIQNKSVILESDIIEIESTVAKVDDRLIEPEIPVSEIVESELEIQNKSVILESDIIEIESTLAKVDDQLTALESAPPNPPSTGGYEEIELGVSHQDVRSETDVAATKFNVGKEIKFEPSLADVDQELPPLPNGYGQSQIFLLPRDPNWAYAYWDIPNEHKEHLRHQGGKHLLLRVYDVTSIDIDTQPPLSTQEYECDEMAREWHIPIAMSDRDYIAELGYLTVDGRWLILVRSNHIHIPPVYPTDWENYQFINIPWDEDLRGKTFFRL
ncbi:Rho termination factor-like protein [Planktothrix agardhii NIES-204]|nr:Rho termination factor-like protein [Planktothrix agardhii NIES-204]